MKRIQVFAGLILLIVVIGIGFVVLIQPRRAPIDTLVMELEYDPRTMDPHSCYEAAGNAQAFNIYETLYTYPWGSNSTEASVPLLASAPPVLSAGGRQYNITLRQNVIFHDGTPFNASCVKWNVERAAKMFRPAGPAWMIIEPLKGGQALSDMAKANGPNSAEFIAAFDEWVADSGAIVVLNTYKVQFNLEEPYAPFIAAMTYQVGSMISPTYVLRNPNNDTGTMDSHYGLYYGEELTYMHNHTCGTGPYVLDEWRHNEFIKLSLFEDYWRADATDAAIKPPDYAGSLKTIFCKKNDEPGSRMMNLRTGIADIVGWSPEHFDDIWDNVTMGSRDPNIHVNTEGVSYSLTAFSFNFKHVNITGNGVSKIVQSPFIFRELRKCFTYAFNYEIFISGLAGGWAMQAKGFIPRGLFGYNSSYWAEEHNITAAVDWWNLAMQNSTFVDYINAMEGYIDLYFVHEVPFTEQVCLLLKDGFAEVMMDTRVNVTGVTVPIVRVSVLGLPDYLLRRSKGELALYLVGWAPDFADPDCNAWAFVYSEGVHSSWSGYKNERVDELVYLARMERDPDTRQDYYNEMQELVAYDQTHVYLIQNKVFGVQRAWLKGNGLVHNPMHDGYWYHMYKDFSA
ncbi:MAG: ABC transporter substrate-binding protein [Candidatus Thorarchaeota archaeon]|jgi:peptide/nickel transport system substrate-binding protein